MKKETEHSKALRAKTATDWNRKQIAAGNIRYINLKLPTEIAEAFDRIAKENNVSRPQALKLLISTYDKRE